MGINLDVLELFINNSNSDYSISDIMRSAGVCWITARDSITCLYVKDWIFNKNGRWYLNKDKIKFIKISA